MFRKKKDLRIVELTPSERRLMIQSMMRFRNKLMALNKPTEDINDLLLRLYNSI